MKLDFKVDKKACFYYWLQAVSGWDIHSSETESYQYYQNLLNSTPNEEQGAISQIKDLLLSSTNPRQVLAELYASRPELNEAMKIAQLAKPLEPLFEPVWQEAQLGLQTWRKRLKSMDFDDFTPPLQRIAHFLDSAFEPEERVAVYLIQSPTSAGASGHHISGTGFILLHPPGEGRAGQEAAIISTILHEYVHLVEFRSKTTVGLFRQSYESHIRPRKINPPPGCTWKYMYREAIAYCFANSITGGYFRPETFQKPRPTVDEMQAGFWRLVKRGGHNTNHVISWVALNVLAEVEDYIDQGKAIDQKIADRIGELYAGFYADV